LEQLGSFPLSSQFSHFPFRHFIFISNSNENTSRHPQANLSILGLPLLALVPIVQLELLGVGLEEVDRLLRVLAGNVDEGRSRNVISLSGADQRVVLEEILALGFIVVACVLMLVMYRARKKKGLTLSVEYLLRFGSVEDYGLA